MGIENQLVGCEKSRFVVLKEGEHESGYQLKIEAVAFEDSIIMPPLNFAERVGSLYHEYGHIIGEQLSFKSGDVLTPDEVKRTKVDLTWQERIYLMRNMYFGRKTHINPNEHAILNKFLTAFTKGNFDPSEVKLINLSEERFKRNFRKVETDTLTEENGKLIGVSSREGRNTELPAYATSIGCLTLMENSTTVSIFGTNIFEVEFLYPEGIASHGRAMKIVNRAYQSEGYVLPSTVDLYPEED